MRSYLEHNLCIKDDSIYNELITGFNQAIQNNTVKQLNVKKYFTIQRVPFWIADEGLVLSSIDLAGAHLWTKLSGKLTLNTASRNLLYNHLALLMKEPKSFIRQ